MDDYVTIGNTRKALLAAIAKASSDLEAVKAIARRTENLRIQRIIASMTPDGEDRESEAKLVILMDVLKHIQTDA